MSKPIFERMEETLSRNDPRVWEIVFGKDADYWKRRALEASAVPCGHPFPPPPAMIEAPRPDAARERPLARDADYWNRLDAEIEKHVALVKARDEAAQGADHSPHSQPAEPGTPSRPHPHAPLHRAIGRSQNGLPDPQTPNQVFWERPSN